MQVLWSAIGLLCFIILCGPKNWNGQGKIGLLARTWDKLDTALGAS